jgi:hypothetical protein
LYAPFGRPGLDGLNTSNNVKTHRIEGDWKRDLPLAFLAAASAQRFAISWNRSDVWFRTTPGLDGGVLGE